MKFADVKEGMRVANVEDPANKVPGVVKKIYDVHNVEVEYDKGGAGIFCLDENCAVYEGNFLEPINDEAMNLEDLEPIRVSTAKKLEKAKKKLADLCRGVSCVNGIGISMKKGEYHIVLNYTEKLPILKLLPKEVDGFKVRMQLIGKIVFQS